MTGQQLKAWREAEGLSVRQLTAKLRDVSASTVSRWEQTETVIPSWVEDRLFNTGPFMTDETMLALILLARDEGKSPGSLLEEILHEWAERKRAEKRADLMR